MCQRHARARIFALLEQTLGQLRLDGSLPQPVPDVVLIQHYLKAKAGAAQPLANAPAAAVEQSRPPAAAKTNAPAEGAAAESQDPPALRAVEPVAVVRLHKKKSKKSKKSSPKIKRQPKTPRKVS